MVLTPLKALLVIAGVLVAGGLVYFTGIFNSQTEQSQAVVDSHAPTEAAEGATATGGEPGDAPIVAEAGDQRAATDEQVIVPAFDLLRVEPDGSLVIAGRAVAGAEVEIVSGSSLLAKTTAGPTGDFAAVLDKPLKPGEHNIVLRATSKDNVAATSLETAIVSVPTAENGQVVALVQQPGEPSRLITTPEAEAPPSGETAGLDERQKDAPASGQDGAVQAGGATQSMGPESGAGSIPQSSEIAEAKPGETSGSHASGEAAQEGPAQAEMPSDTPNKDEPFIEAVEIDGRNVFVAGRAAPGRTMRIYANDILLGQATVSPEGRFLIEAERDLPVGDYIIRADVLADDEGTVIARAAVPFERHEGEKIAAVAPRSLAQTPPAQGASHAGETRQDARAAGEGLPDGATRPDARELAETGPNAGNGNMSRSGAVEDRLGDRVASAGGNELRSDDRTLGRDSSEVTSPPLEPVGGSVIIRRGDTLWQISRRIYGRGIRYTTIYLANQSQIRDPDRIWPGQVFTVPNQTREGERADMDAAGAEEQRDYSTSSR